MTLRKLAILCVCVLMHFVWKWPGMMVGALAAAQLSSAAAWSLAWNPGLAYLHSPQPKSSGLIPFPAGTHTHVRTIVTRLEKIR